tara:strand:+ start:184 stop:1917 length:1734 start_codon:yes stop_codon:yes gene_type:complete
MCGIFGIYSKKKLNNEDVKFANRAKKFLNHRGPDEFNLFQDDENNLILCHSRLSIIDISKKNSQPRKENNNVLVFNGEIYNFRELKKNYLQDSHFETNGDTEVLLKMWIKYGSKCLDYLDGMYAFALWDSKNLFLVTDFFGEKPLFIFEHKDKILFSSEAKIFTEIFKSKIDSNNTLFFDFFGIQINKERLIKRIKKISRNTILKIESGKIIQQNSIKKQTNIKKKIYKIKNQNLEEILDLLIKSIKKRLISDQKISILQSGGYDSTLLLAIIKKEIKKDFQCYHLEQDSMSERKQILRNFEHLKISKDNIKFINFEKSLLKIENYLNYHYQLTDNYSIALMDSITSSIARDGIRVALTGTGGDELFYGYNKYFNAFKLQKKINLFSKLPFFNFFKKKLKNDKINFLDLENYFEYISYLKNDSNYKHYKKIKNLSYKFEDFFQKKENLFLDTRKFDLNFTLPENLNFNQDIASMKNSIELRSPFLNCELFEYIENLDHNLLFNLGPKTISKILLKKFFNLDIPKSGFSLFYETQNFFIKKNIILIKKHKLENIFKINFQLGFKELYKKELINKLGSF